MTSAAARPSPNALEQARLDVVATYDRWQRVRDIHDLFLLAAQVPAWSIESLVSGGIADVDPRGPHEQAKALERLLERGFSTNTADAHPQLCGLLGTASAGRQITVDRHPPLDDSELRALVTDLPSRNQLERAKACRWLMRRLVGEQFEASTTAMEYSCLLTQAALGSTVAGAERALIDIQSASADKRGAGTAVAELAGDPNGSACEFGRAYVAAARRGFVPDGPEAPQYADGRSTGTGLI